jgi:hypothetical protein
MHTDLEDAMQVGYIARHAKCLFRKSVWSEVVSIMGTDDTDTTHTHSFLHDPKTFSALQHTNWNLVERARQNATVSSTTITAGTSVGAGGSHGGISASAYCPVCVVMFHVDMTPTTEHTRKGWSDTTIAEIVTKGVIYGAIKENTHIAVQIFFKGLRLGSGLLSDPSVSTDLADAKETDYMLDEAVAIVLVDKSAIAYCYNIPSDDYDKAPIGMTSVSQRLVARLLFVSTGQTMKQMVKMVGFKPRSPYDDNLYAMYITASCAFESTTRAFYASAAATAAAAAAGQTCCCNAIDHYYTDIGSCRPSQRRARPSRAISNLRFIMFMSSAKCCGLVEGLLLDELNTLDAFRRTAFRV